MSMGYLIGAAILVIVAFVLLVRKDKTFPPKGHRIFLKEADISCNALIEGVGNVFLIGRPDLVTVDMTDMLHVYEYKTRKNETVYLADKIQLALYKFILERTRDMRVSNVGHIVFLRNGQREKVVPVALATVDIPAHVAAYVRDTRQDPGCTMNGKCRNCLFQNDCRTNY
jgi:CRISPR/Cas system-associated exonuclease Cas4 (RecB family)